MTFFQWIDRYFQRRHVRQILARLEQSSSNEELLLQESFDPKKIAIYRVPFPAEPRISLGFDDDQQSNFTFHQGFREILGLGHRAYIVDSAPDALFGKANALFLFPGVLSFRGIQTRITQQPIFINDVPFDYFTPE